MCTDDQIQIDYLDSVIESLSSSNASLDESIRTIGEENNELTKENDRLREALEGIRDHEHCKHGLSMQTANEYIAGYVNGCRFMSSIASKGLNEMEGVK